MFWAMALSGVVLGGLDETAVRLPSALAAIGSVLLVYAMGLPALRPTRGLARRDRVRHLLEDPVAGARRADRHAPHLPRPVRRLLLDEGSPRGPPRARRISSSCSPASPRWPRARSACCRRCSRSSPSSLSRSIARASAICVSGAACCCGGASWCSGSAPAILLGGDPYSQDILLRQNVTRYVNPWGHYQPPWYFLQVLPVDFLPWSLFLPAAIAVGATLDRERRRHLLFLGLLGGGDGALLQRVAGKADGLRPHLLPGARAARPEPGSPRCRGARSRAIVGRGGWPGRRGFRATALDRDVGRAARDALGRGALVRDPAPAAGRDRDRRAGGGGHGRLRVRAAPARRTHGGGARARSRADDAAALPAGSRRGSIPSCRCARSPRPSRRELPAGYTLASFHEMEGGLLFYGAGLAREIANEEELRRSSRVRSRALADRRPRRPRRAPLAARPARWSLARTRATDSVRVFARPNRDAGR